MNWNAYKSFNHHLCNYFVKMCDVRNTQLAFTDTAFNISLYSLAFTYI